MVRPQCRLDGELSDGRKVSIVELTVHALHPASYGKQEYGIRNIITFLFCRMGGKGGIFMSRSLSARSNIYRIVVDALFVALYVILGTYLSFKIPGAIQISFSTLPILLCAFLFHPSDAVAVAVIGNLLEQIIDPSPYGFATLLIWLIPGAVQALVASFGAQLVHRAASKKRALILMIAVIVCADLVLTLLNTGALYLDGYLLDYPVKALHLLMPMRVVNAIVRSVISCILLPLLLPPLKRVLARW